MPTPTKLTAEERAEVARRLDAWRTALLSSDSYETRLPALREAVACGWTIHADEFEFTADAQEAGFTYAQCRFMWAWLGRFKRDAIDEA